LITKEQSFGPEEVIFREGEEIQKLYFLQSGEVEIFLDNIKKNSTKNSKDRRTLKILKKNSIIGDYQFFTGDKAEFSVMSCNLINIIYI